MTQSVTLPTGETIGGDRDAGGGRLGITMGLSPSNTLSGDRNQMDAWHDHLRALVRAPGSFELPLSEGVASGVRVGNDTTLTLTSTVGEPTVFASMELDHLRAVANLLAPPGELVA